MRQRPPVIANTRTAPIWPPAYTTSRIVARPDCNGGRHTPTASPSFAWACPASRRSCTSPYPERNANRGRGPSSPANASQTPIRTPKRPTYRPHFSPPIELDCPGVIPEMFNNRVKTSAYSVPSNASISYAFIKLCYSELSHASTAYYSCSESSRAFKPSHRITVVTVSAAFLNDRG